MLMTKQALVVVATASLCVACGTGDAPDGQRDATTSSVDATPSDAATADRSSPRESSPGDDERAQPRGGAPDAAGAAGPAHVVLSEVDLTVQTAPSRQARSQGRALPAPPPDGRPPALPTVDREGYEEFDDDPVHRAADDPVSTFSVDVDTAAYANVRRFLNRGALPRADAVRTEEIINYFDYAYPQPGDGNPFAVHTEVGPSPWHAERKLIHIGIQGARKSLHELPASNLVFLVDVSGSMRSPDKLELLKSSLKLLTSQMRDEDTIAIAVYAGAAGVVLEPTPAHQRAKIIAALDRLSAGGSTNGGAGIALAYSLAERALVEGGVNRVILATDGDFNVGTINHAALEELVEDKRELGIALTVLGFGSGNYQDGLMQRLAQIGNGNAAYIDSLNEARKVLVDELAATLEVIAQDVKIQVEFNPAVVAEYRLIGYETRKLAREDFNNDRVDAGDIGAGHTVTALYEIALVGSGGQLMDPLRYGRHDAGSQSSDRGQRAAPSGEIAHLRLRYKRPGERDSELREFPLHQRPIIPRLADTSDDYRFSAAAAAFGQLLRGGRYTGVFSFADVADLARGARGEDHFGYRGEFLRLVDTADALSGAKVSQR
jgi:Ca-activated chloride channel family protein